MIPKKIHYCWFGGKEKPKLAEKCINSWKKFCPDYEIIEWNEENFDLNLNSYTQWCYKEKKYAFLSDFVRLYVVEKYGGVYFDTDVELVKSINELMKNKAFFGFETAEFVASGLGFGSEAGGVVVKSMLMAYDSLLDGKHGTIGCPILNTNALIELGLITNGQYQVISDAAIYPRDWFNPYDAPTGRLNKTQNTVSIHWYSASWMNKKTKIRSKIARPFHRIFGEDCFQWIKRKF